MSHELFTDLSVEQQAIVAGGVGVLDFSTAYSKFFSQTEVIGPVGSTSGLGGSSIVAGGVQKTTIEAIQTGTYFKALVG
ncbi:hypothetical protein H6G80_09030 [Nostoc sp. FACHB-87]|uniref:CTB family bacteriocin n=1 Tax=Nostocales TaxID=1161 RepID=UPI001686FCAE|nr:MULTISPECIES: CTB family bacteriocin [Nostocales]MBD2298260.1 hypothetical protein [Nostoc sp. FACHB-190]MBD2454221.1 hypothetical protein [Nostoc sp. FACHB-87]MBD2474188.1 hypothetical protein [Anabaena sp. FACHB-83]MBD2488788.1 hypothetical protein [Aulosira sp. FACHB-615]